jgi:hypothetical protein
VPREFFDHLVDATRELGTSERPIGVEEGTRFAKVHTGPDRKGAQLNQDGLERLRRADPAMGAGREATRGDGLEMQFIADEVDGVLDDAGVGVVVLRAKPDRCVRRGEGLTESVPVNIGRSRSRRSRIVEW